ncbi:CocE/NonD hydrolase [Polyplosphaeria fusca]|uniref:CocE/NonD hydrolase n=1 Tax=Polyplosphaeria fusca TaxID=682080 RepID=A0A9P4UUI8_9PLEO|nr:CocE/NonD hydrolase [Polyplosphaeria fusca]
MAQPRGFVGAACDSIISRVWGLPPESSSYTICEVRIPIGDQGSRIQLAATLWQPILARNEQLAGTLLSRCPYGLGFGIPQLLCRVLAARRYQVLFVGCRGTFQSEGEFDPFRTEVEDGKACVEWMRKQDWYTGSFATVGCSYLGFTQWALLRDPPKDMVTAVISIGPHDFSRVSWGTGALNLDIVRWAYNIAHQEESFWQVMYRNLTVDRTLKPVLDGFPLHKSVEDHFDGKAPWLNELMHRPNLSDPYYEATQLGQALDRVDIPILLSTGWYDLFLEQTMEQYYRLKERDVEVALTVGSWTHAGTALSPVPNRQMLGWLDEHMLGETKEKREHPLQYYVTGAEEWRYAATFPARTTAQSLYFDAGNKLSKTKPSLQSETSTFTFNPRDPTPLMGGNILMNGGCVEDTALAARSDTVVFTTEPLEEDVEFVGQPSVEIFHTTDNPHADLFVRISEVDNKGKSKNICDGFQRLDLARSEELVKLKLHHRAHRFVKGATIRLLIAGGSHPHLAKNPGMEEANATAEIVKSVKHTVQFGNSKLSRIILPVL